MGLDISLDGLAIVMGLDTILEDAGTWRGLDIPLGLGTPPPLGLDIILCMMKTSFDFVFKINFKEGNAF